MQSSDECAGSPEIFDARSERLVGPAFTGRNHGDAGSGRVEGCREEQDVDHHRDVSVQRDGVGTLEGLVETEQVAGLLMGREHAPVCRLATCRPANTSDDPLSRLPIYGMLTSPRRARSAT